MITEQVTVGCIFHLPRKEDFYVVLAKSGDNHFVVQRIRDGAKHHQRIDALMEFGTLVYKPTPVSTDTPLAWHVDFRAPNGNGSFSKIYTDEAEVKHWARLHELADFYVTVTPLVPQRAL